MNVSQQKRLHSASVSQPGLLPIHGVSSAAWPRQKTVRSDREPRISYDFDMVKGSSPLPTDNYYSDHSYNIHITFKSTLKSQFLFRRKPLVFSDLWRKFFVTTPRGSSGIASLSMAWLALGSLAWRWTSLVDGLEHFIFFHLLGIIIPID